MARRRKPPATWAQRSGLLLAGGIKLTIDRAKEKLVLRRLKTLPKRVQRSVVSSAATKAMTPVVKAARKLAPKRTGFLAKSIGKRTKRYSKDGKVLVVVGPRVGFRDPKTGEVPAKIAHLIEFGTAAHDIKLTKNAVIPGVGSGFLPKGYVIKHPGSKAHPFMRPALDSQKNVVVRKYSEAMAKGITRQVAKLAREA